MWCLFVYPVREEESVVVIMMANKRVWSIDPIALWVSEVFLQVNTYCMKRFVCYL